MANSLLEVCNNWQIQRAEILDRNPEMTLTIQKLDMMVEYAVRSAMDIATALTGIFGKLNAWRSRCTGRLSRWH